MQDRSKHLETILVISAGLIVFFFILDVRALLYVAPGLSLAGVLIPFVAKWVHKGWMGLAMALGFVNSHILLALIYFLVLTPLALMRRLGGKDPLQLRRKQEGSYFTEQEHTYEAKDLKNPW